jgi:hypothetical protein
MCSFKTYSRSLSLIISKQRGKCKSTFSRTRIKGKIILYFCEFEVEREKEKDWRQSKELKTNKSKKRTKNGSK